MAKKNIINKQSKLYKFYSENKYIILSSLIAFLISQLVAFCFELIPYGNMTILRMDLYHQYGPLFGELYDRITSGESLVYSWNSGLGATFLGNFLNYLSSPFSIIILLFGHKNITEAISCMIMLKVVFSAGTFTYYLKKSLNQHNAFTAGFGILYAFCGYFVAYYWNLMWIDAMVFFPLVILGIETIIKKGKPQLYCISLALTMFSNYYMAYMVCLFSVIYFLIYYFSNYPLNKKFDEKSENKSFVFKFKNSLFFNSGLKFAVYSIIAGCLSAISLLPLVMVLSQSSATSGTMPTETLKYFDVFDFLANHLASTEATIRSSGDVVLPNVYCGILTVMLVPLYLFSKKITVREKTANILLLAVLYFSFNINILNYIWHGFHFPNDLPYRFSFMYSFVLLTIAVKALINIKEYTGRQLLAAGMGLVAFIILVEKITSANINDTSLMFSLVFAVGYVVILYMFKDKRFQTSAVSILLLCTISSEIALGNTDKYSMNQPKESYIEGYDDFKEIKSKIDEHNGDTLYRMELTYLKTTMDPSWLDYNGVSIFSSMAYESVANLQRQVGLYGNFINSYTYGMQTPVYNAMFGLKYIVDNNDNVIMNTELMNELFSVNEYTAYENKYPLSVAFAVNKAASKWDASSYDNPFIAQSDFFRLSSGVDGVFTRLDVSSVEYNNIEKLSSESFSDGNFAIEKVTNNQTGSVCFEIIPQKTQNVYIYIDSKEIESAYVSSDDFSHSVPSTNEPHIYDVGLITEGSSVFVDINFKVDSNLSRLKFCAYGLEQDVFEKGYNKLSAGDFNIIKNTDTMVTGTIKAESDSTVFTSIPYDINWRVYVDGERLSKDQIYKISNALLAFDIPAGEHTIVFNYYSSGLVVGEFISCLTIIISTIIIILKRRKLLFFKKVKFNKWNLLNLSDFVIKEEEKSASGFDLNIEEEVSDTFLNEENPSVIQDNELTIEEKEKEKEKEEEGKESSEEESKNQ